MGDSGRSGLGLLITEPDQGYTPIYTLLSSAKHTLDMTMYEFSDSSAEKALIDDAARGVTVRVLLDKQYHGGPFNQPVFDDLARHHVKVQWASTQVSITHQKSFVIDGKKAVIMTGNLTSRYYPTSRDFALVDTKKTDVDAIEATFTLDWADSKGTARAVPIWSGAPARKPASRPDRLGQAQPAGRERRDEGTANRQRARRRSQTRRQRPGRHDRLAQLEEQLRRAQSRRRQRAHLQEQHQDALHPRQADRRRRPPGLPWQRELLRRSLQYNRELGLITTSTTILRAIKTTFASDYASATPW